MYTILFILFILLGVIIGAVISGWWFYRKNGFVSGILYLFVLGGGAIIGGIVGLVAYLIYVIFF